MKGLCSFSKCVKSNTYFPFSYSRKVEDEQVNKDQILMEKEAEVMLLGSICIYCVPVDHPV